MRFLLLLALLLYDIIIDANRVNFDYIDGDGGKRHSLDERRTWRKKALMRSLDHDQRDWDDKRYERTKYYDDTGPRLTVSDRELETALMYNTQRHFNDRDKSVVSRARSMEMEPNSISDKREPKKVCPMDCVRPNERYEPCFSGCAAVTCDNPRHRLRPCYPFCEPGCICVRPHVRDDRTHKCVLPEDCSKGLKGIPDLGEDV